MIDIRFRLLTLLDRSFVALSVPNVKFIFANLRTSLRQMKRGAPSVDFITALHDISCWKIFYFVPNMPFYVPAYCDVT